MNTEIQASQQKILILTQAGYFDLDKFLSAVVFGKLLMQKGNISVDIFFGNKPVPKELWQVVIPKDVNFLEKLDANYFTLSIDRGNAKISEVKWEEKGDQIKLLIFTEKGAVDTKKYSMEAGSPVYDKLYVFGIKSEEKAKAALGNYSSLWNATETYFFDIFEPQTKFAQTNHIYADAKSYAEGVTKFAESQEIQLDTESSTELLSGIYWKTNSLRNKYATSETFTKVQKLLKSGASLLEASSKVYSTMTFAELKARQDIYQSVKITSDKLAFAYVSPETVKLLNHSNPIFPEKNPLYTLKDALTSFVLVPLSSTQTLVLASSRDSSLNLKNKFNKYNFVGDNLQAEMTFNMNRIDTEKEISRIMEVKETKDENRETEKKENHKPITPTIEQKPAAAKPTVIPEIKSEPKVAMETPTLTSSLASNEKGDELPAVYAEPEVIEPVPEVVETKEEYMAELRTEKVETKPEAATELSTAKELEDPLKPAIEEIVPEPAPEEAKPASPFGDFGGFGGGMNGGNSSDPLPAASDEVQK